MSKKIEKALKELLENLQSSNVSLLEEIPELNREDAYYLEAIATYESNLSVIHLLKTVKPTKVSLDILLEKINKENTERQRKIDKLQYYFDNLNDIYYQLFRIAI